MWRRLAVSALATAIGFGALALNTAAPAGAYTAPGLGIIDRVIGSGFSSYGGDGGPADEAGLVGHGDIAVDPNNGNVVFADANNTRVRIVPKVSGTYYGVPMTADYIYTIAGNGSFGYAGDGGPAASAVFNFPNGIAIIPSGPFAGTVLVSDSYNNRIRAIPSASGSLYGMAVTQGYIYTIVGDGTFGFADGAALSAQLWSPMGLTFDASGNVVIADNSNNRVRVMATSDGSFYGQSMTAGYVYTIAGTASYGYNGDDGSATSATLTAPQDVLVDPNGNVVITDSFNYRVRVIAESTGTFYGQSMTAGYIYTIVGDGTATYFGDGGPSQDAGIYLPFYLALDLDDNLIITDIANERVRMIAVSTGSFYDQPMTAGDIYTIAGNGTQGGNGNGGPAVEAELDAPSGVAVDANGTILMTDNNTDTIRAVGGEPPAPPEECSGTGPESQLIVFSSVDPDTLTPPQSSASQWTAHVINTGSETETCVRVHFAVDIGALNGLYYEISQGSGCTFTSVTEIECDLGSIDGENDATATVAISAKGLHAPDTITATVDTTSTFSGGATDQSFVSIEAPTPGEVSSFVPPAGSTFTDKKTSPTANIIAKMKLPRLVAAGSFGVLPHAGPPLVTSAGAVISMQRLPESSDTELCPGGICFGDIMHLDDFANYNDPRHPATLTLNWDPSAYGNGLVAKLYVKKPGHPVAQVMPCAKVHGVHTVLPCVSKTKVNTAFGSPKYHTITYIVLLLSGDPGFARK